MWEAGWIDKASPAWTWGQLPNCQCLADSRARVSRAAPFAAKGGPPARRPGLQLPAVFAAARPAARSPSGSRSIADARARGACASGQRDVWERLSSSLSSETRRWSGEVPASPPAWSWTAQRRCPPGSSALLSGTGAKEAARAGRGVPRARAADTDRRCYVRTVRGAWGWGPTGFRGVVLQAPGWHSAERCEPRDSDDSSGVAAGGVSGAGRDARGPELAGCSASCSCKQMPGGCLRLLDYLACLCLCLSLQWK